MINMPIADIMTLIAGEVEKPAAAVAGDDMTDASFLSFIAGDDTELGQSGDVPDTDADRSDNSVDIPESRAMLLSGMTDQRVAFMPVVGPLKLDDALPVQNRPPEKMTNAILPISFAGPNDDAPDIVPVKVAVELPALQVTDTAVDVPRSMREAASIPPLVVVPDKQANAAILNDAPKQVSLPATYVMPHIGSGSFQPNVLTPIAAMSRPHMFASIATDLVPSTSTNTALPMAPGATPKVVPGAPLGDQQPSDKQSRHAPAEVTETKENHRGHPISDMSTPRPVNAPKVLAPDNAQMPKGQNPLPRYMPNPPAGDMPNRVDPLQTQAVTSEPLQVIKGAHPFVPLQPAALLPQSPKRQMSEGKLPEPDVQPVKQTAIDTVAQSTVPAVQPSITPMPDAPTLEGALPDLNPELIPLETRAADSTSIARHDTITNRPEVGRHIAQQLAEVVRQMPDRPVELTLNPDELGRVRLTFTMSDGGIHVAVIAERGETMDLLRRHIETLAQEFRDMGYKDVNFEFSRNGQGDSGGNNSNPDDPAAQAETPTEMQTPAPVQLSLEPSTGLDLRL